MRHQVFCAFVLWALLSFSLSAEEPKPEPWDMLTAKPEVVEAWQDISERAYLNVRGAGA